ncbi:MAG TPA: prolyl oligopeptidase family serine peptidase [Salinivirgaceae bacterium]|nr:prolyl oligopeptidase family serine peptidase [Salinivirgaceae bacterium]HQA75824.1 prolyl oligopeptidase family serine peptidase [Salinivirgaceae bacterium]
MRVKIFTLTLTLLISGTLISQTTCEQATEKLNDLLQHRLDRVEKLVDDVMWFQRLNDIAYVDKLFITGPPLAKEKNPTALGAGNPVKFWTYAIFPKDIDRSKKYPLIVLPHGGVHADFTTYHFHIVREMISQGYIVVAPEYRGSTGYGKGHYEKIDYGGLEVDDVLASKNYMIENYSFIDKNRVGIVGWSHGGLITLMNIFNFPDDYKVAFAGVPVSDIVARMGYYHDDYRELFEADYHIGKSAHEDVNEYRRRSPAWNTHKFKDTPLLIHTNTNDEDVNVLEVEHLIKSLKADNKKFEYEIFKDIPGGHSFDRMDTKTAKEIRVKIYKFLSKYLKPENPITNLEQLNKAGYKF